jgi:ribosomal protein S18 acetylase RimI-like enzyme
MQFEHPVGIERDKWIGEQVGCPAFKVSICNDDLDVAEDVFLPGDGEAAVFVYAKVPVSHQRAVNYLLSKGFQFVETTVLYVKSVTVPENVAASGFRFADTNESAAHIDALGNLARDAFVFGDFHVDPKMSASVGGRIREQWVRNFFHGTRGTHMIVSESDGEISGFLLLVVSPPDITIDLIAVAGNYRGKGIASDLIRFAETCFSDCTTISAGTQISNAPSIGLYSKLGFTFSKATYALHFCRDGAVS